jgi:hypothetical protein
VEIKNNLLNLSLFVLSQVIGVDESDLKQEIKERDAALNLLNSTLNPISESDHDHVLRTIKNNDAVHDKLFQIYDKIINFDKGGISDKHIQGLTSTINRWITSVNAHDDIPVHPKSAAKLSDVVDHPPHDDIAAHPKSTVKPTKPSTATTTALKPEGWWSKALQSKSVQKIKNTWKDIAQSKEKINDTVAHIYSEYKNTGFGHFIKYDMAKMCRSYDSYVGGIHQVPEEFSLWMPGVAVVAASKADKKKLNGLYVCETLEAFASKLNEIGQSKENQRCAFVIGTFSSGSAKMFNFHSHFKPNYPQHKATVCVEKKDGKLSIALLDAAPVPEYNQKIDPKNVHGKRDLWEGIDEKGRFNSQELAFRAIIKGCTDVKDEARFLHSQVLRQKHFGCETFALHDAITFLENRDFFDKITTSDQSVKLDGKNKIEIINYLPPEYMVGTQSIKLLKQFENKIDASLFNKALPGKTKSFKKCIDEHTIKALNEEQNHYITKKALIYLNFVIEILKANDNGKEEEVKKIIKNVFLTDIDKKLFPKGIPDSLNGGN